MMTKKTKNIILVVIGIALILAIFYFSNKNRKTPPKDNVSGLANAFIDSDRLLKKGDVGADVQSLQQGYNYYFAVPKGLPKLVEDGNFGSKTEAGIYAATGRKQIRLSQFSAIFND